MWKVPKGTRTVQIFDGRSWNDKKHFSSVVASTDYEFEDDECIFEPIDQKASPSFATMGAKGEWMMNGWYGFWKWNEGLVILVHSEDVDR